MRLFTGALIALYALFLCPWYAHSKDVFQDAGVVVSKSGIVAPEFTLPDVDGRERALSDYKGKLVLLNFWATWCEPCRDEMPAMERLWKEYKAKGLVVVAVAGDKGNIHKVGEFCKMREVSFPVLLDPSGDVKSAYGATMFPTSFLIGKDGAIKGKIVGPRQWDAQASRRLFETLLKDDKQK